MDEVNKEASPYSVPGLIREGEGNSRKVTYRAKRSKNIDTPPWIVAAIPVLVEKLCNRYMVSTKVFYARNRRAELVYMRQLFIHWLRATKPEITLKNMGKLIGDRDYTSMIYSSQEFQYRLKYNSPIPPRLHCPSKEINEDYQLTSKFLSDACDEFKTDFNRNKRQNKDR